MEHLERNSFLTNLQHGFRKQHGCETQLLTVVEDLAKGLDSGSQCDLVILDFQKAFDKVPHLRLLRKLEYCGVKDQTHKWIENWLTTRTQRVVVDGEQSPLAEVTSGVPQGTVLGPLMFLIYINDIVLNLNSQIRLFADDALLYREIRNGDDQKILQEDLNTLCNWAEKWQMSFNIGKCKQLTINKRERIPTEYVMKGTTLESVSHHPYLGLEFTNDLSSWN